MLAAGYRAARVPLCNGPCCFQCGELGRSSPRSSGHWFDPAISSKQTSAADGGRHVHDQLLDGLPIFAVPALLCLGMVQSIVATLVSSVPPLVPPP